jgi:Ala-tRNA(Pro) deacylase
MALASLLEHLDKHNVQYVVITHSPAYTAQGIAGLTHISGKELAKTVMVKLDGRLVMAVVPAMLHVDLALLKTAANAKAAALASEDDFRDVFPQCETGAMPPFGKLFGITVFADESLTKDKEIAFNAGTHRELIRMAWEDFQKLAEPRIARFGIGKTSAAA